jgi:hypothetical protein
MQWFVALCIVLSCVQIAFSEPVSFVIDETVSTFEYGPPTGGPGIEGCGLLGFGPCVFGMSGTFDFDVNTDSQSARFLNVDVSLSGHELSDNPFITSRLASVLTSLEFQPDDDGLFSSIGTVQVQLSPASLVLTGGVDRQPSDGDLVLFNVQAFVPEPQLTWVTIAISLLVFRRC